MPHWHQVDYNIYVTYIHTHNMYYVFMYVCINATRIFMPRNVEAASNQINAAICGFYNLA